MADRVLYIPISILRIVSDFFGPYRNLCIFQTKKYPPIFMDVFSESLLHLLLWLQERLRENIWLS